VLPAAAVNVALELIVVVLVDMNWQELPMLTAAELPLTETVLENDVTELEVTEKVLAIVDATAKVVVEEELKVHVEPARASKTPAPVKLELAVKLAVEPEASDSAEVASKLKTALATVLVKEVLIERNVDVKTLLDPVFVYVLSEYVVPAVPVRSQLQLQSSVPPEPLAPLKSTAPLEVDPQMEMTVVLVMMVTVLVVTPPTTVWEPSNVRLELFAWSHIFGSYCGSSASSIPEC